MSTSSGGHSVSHQTLKNNIFCPHPLLPQASDLFTVRCCFAPPYGAKPAGPFLVNFCHFFPESFGAFSQLSGVAPANQTEESEACELPGKESAICSLTPFLEVLKTIYKPKGVPEPVPDSFPGSSQTSLSSVWFARATSDNLHQISTSFIQFQSISVSSFVNFSQFFYQLQSVLVNFSQVIQDKNARMSYRQEGAAKHRICLQVCDRSGR